MPGPGSRAKSTKSKGHKPKISTISSPSDADNVYIAEIDNAQGWNVIINILCGYLSLPDLTTRSGLKKVHANFNAIYTKIDKVYQRNIDNFKIRGAIIAIYSKMCVDSLLRNKLFDKGVVDMIVPLLQVDDTRHLALRSLGTITHHGGIKVRTEIAKHSAVLCKLIRDFPDDNKVLELGIVTLSHAIYAVVDGNPKPSNPTVLKSIDMVDVLKTALEVSKRPHPHSRIIINHVIEMISASSLHAYSAFKTYPSSINFLVAGMRSKDWITRSICLRGLLNLYAIEGEDDQRQLDPSRFLSALQRGTPDHLSDVMMDYGLMCCDMYLTLKCSGEFQRAMMQCAQDHDLYSLGKKQAELILKTEFSIADGMFEVEDPVTRRRTFDSCGLPFQRWSDSLTHGAKAIRRMKKRGEEDLADILEIKHFIMKQRVSDAIAQAKKCIERSPEQAYFYYAITLSADPVQGLKAAKKGLKCKQITPFVKYQLMQRAVQHAAEIGIKILQEMPEAGEPKWEEGIAFFMSALDDAKTYLNEAPPDNRHMKNVGYWYILLTMIIKEDLSPDLKELQPNLQKLKIADEFSQFVGVSPPKTFLRLAQQAAVKHYPGAVREFSRIFNDHDNAIGTGSENPSAGGLEDDLAAWLDKMTLEDGTEEKRGHCGATTGHGKVKFDHLTLYRCSWCGNPSAALRKCSGCGKTRYCDSACQKSHWTEHKKACQTSA